MSTFLMISDPREENYLGRVGNYFGDNSVPNYSGKIEYATDIERVAKKIGAKAIITNRQEYLDKLLPAEAHKRNSIQNYAGSILSSGKENIDVLVIHPFRSLYAWTYGEFLLKRFLSKVLTPEKWRDTSEFNWAEIKDEFDFDEARSTVSNPKCFLISIDIETSRPNIIREYGFTVFNTDGTSKSYVMEMDSMAKVEFMREINATPHPKVCQNGKYECAYFFAWGAPMVNYIADTKNAMHSWYSELPKNLAFLTALLVRNTMYWKDLAGSGDRTTRLEYNAKDTWSTGEAFLSYLAEAPDYAMFNYINRFRTVPFAHACEMRGLKRDEAFLSKAASEGTKYVTKLKSELELMTGTPGFNPNSPKQVKQLMYVLGHRGKGSRTSLPDSSDEKTLKEEMQRHPLSEAIFNKILEIRGEVKLLGTYMPTGSKSKEYNGRFLYSLNGDGTDTGRYSSNEHHFWCGGNIQNIPQEGGSARRVKQSFIADKGYELFEIDKSQAEARGVAYYSGDPRLLEAVNSENDFHSLNASAFFGIPYDLIYQNAKPEYVDNETGELVLATPAYTLNVPLRNLSKRVNHGANYNMGAGVLLDTMGSVNVRKAQELLKLNPSYSLLEVTAYLLHTFEITYPIVKTKYYNDIKREISLTSKLKGPTGWTRYCFGNPSKNKMDLNSYIAHRTQSLNAMDLDQGFLNIFNWQRRENNWDKLQVFAQIHDSIFGQYKIGHEHLVEAVAKCLHNPIDVTCVSGITRTMDVPVEITYYGARWNAVDDD